MQSPFVPLRALALAALVGCSSPHVVANVRPGADLTAYRTYGFLDELGTDGGDYRSLTSQILSHAAARELRARGYESSEAPDLLVNFYVRTAQRVRSDPVQSSFFFYRRGSAWPYRAWRGHGYESQVRAFSEGALHIDVIDRALREVVWEAIVVQQLTADELNDPSAWAQDAVALAFARFPGTRGTAVHPIE